MSYVVSKIFEGHQPIHQAPEFLRIRTVFLDAAENERLQCVTHRSKRHLRGHRPCVILRYAKQFGKIDHKHHINECLAEHYQADSAKDFVWNEEAMISCYAKGFGIVDFHEILL